MKSVLIGFCGKRQCGKTTAGKIVESVGGTSMSFAYELKKCCGLLTGQTDRIYDEDVKKEWIPETSPPGIYDILNDWTLCSEHTDLILSSFQYDATRDVCRFTPMTYGKLFQFIGTDVIRHRIREDYWIQRCLSQVPPGLTAITDVRFPNEAQAIREHGGIICTIVREDATYHDGRDDQHESERAWKSIRPDDTIVNQGHTFTEQVLRMLHRFAL